MLSTGVDIPDLEFIVFLRPVKSRILFEQMLGRGTRKGEKYPGQVPLHGLRLLRRHAAGVLPQRPRRSPPSRPRSRRKTDRGDHRGHLAEPGPRLQHPLPGQAAPAHRQGDDRRGPRAVRRLHPRRRRRPASPRELPRRLRRRLHGDDEAAARRRLPGPARRTTRGRQRTLRRRATSVEDTVIVRVARSATATGQEYKPERLPGGLRRFVRENPDQIEAIASCSTGPQDWGTDALAELRRSLATAPAALHRWTNLQKAHAAALPQGARGHHLDGQARRRRRRRRC